EVDRQLPEINRELAGRLRGIAVEQHAKTAAQLPDPVDVLYRAGFVVDVHDRNELGVLAQGAFEVGDVEDTVFARLKPADLETPSLQRLERIGHGFVFRRHRDQVPAAVGTRLGGARDCEVVRLGGAGG